MQTTRNRGAALTIAGLIMLLANNASAFPRTPVAFVDQLLESAYAERAVAAWINPELSVGTRTLPQYDI